MPTTITHRQLWPTSNAMRQAGGVDVIMVVLALAVCVALWYVGYRIEPHYVSKDGHRFLCTARLIAANGAAEGRKREVRISVQPYGRLRLDVKRGMRHHFSEWSIEGKAGEPPPRRTVYVLRSLDSAGGTERMIIQLPSKSRAVAVLDQVLAETR
jgi:hypothetical protein